MRSCSSSASHSLPGRAPQGDRNAAWVVSPRQEFEKRVMLRWRPPRNYAPAGFLRDIFCRSTQTFRDIGFYGCFRPKQTQDIWAAPRLAGVALYLTAKRPLDRARKRSRPVRVTIAPPKTSVIYATPAPAIGRTMQGCPAYHSVRLATGNAPTDGAIHQGNSQSS